MRLQKQKLLQAVYGFSLILGFCHHLVPQIGVLHLRDIGVTIQNALGFIHEGLELVLVLANDTLVNTFRKKVDVTEISYIHSICVR